VERRFDEAFEGVLEERVVGENVACVGGAPLESRAGDAGPRPSASEREYFGVVISASHGGSFGRR